MGAHVWGPAFMRDHLLPHGRLTGWAPSAWGGFPAFTFYFPLPSLLVVAFDLVLSYEVAFKLVTVLGAVSLPLAAFLFGRLTGLRYPGPPLLAIATLPFLFDTSFTIYGGNIASTLAGEFAFSLSLSFALVFLGVVARGLDTGRHRGIAAVLFALTGLSHLLPAAFAVVGAGVLLLLKLDRRRLWYVASVGVIGAALMSFWLLPFLMRLSYSNDLGWIKITDYFKALFPSHLRWMVVLGVAGGFAAFGLRVRAALIMITIALASGLMFILAPESRIWNARFLPFWYLSVYLLAGLGVSEVGRSLAGLFTKDSLEPPSWAKHAVPVAALGVTLILVGGPLNAVPSFLPVRAGTASFVGDWAKWNYSGYERKAFYPEYKALLDTMGKLPCGRAMWEYSGELNRYGTTMSLMLLPYWTDECISSMEGLYFESSPTVPFHFLNQSELSKSPSRPQQDLPYRDLNVKEGVEHLQLLGVRYYMASSPETIATAASNPNLNPVATSPPWVIYEVLGSAEVEALDYEPVVVTDIGSDRHDWLRLALPFYQRKSGWSVFLAADGPPDWSRVSDEDSPPRRRVPNAGVSNVTMEVDRISFEVDKTGSPVLVKTSYFPNWKAKGADGPWRVTPNLMVVVPTERRVSLEYGYTPVDAAGWLITLAGIAALAFFRRRPLFVGPDPTTDRFRKLAVITALVTAIDFGVLLILRLEFGLPVVIADAAAIGLASAASYRLHRSISFRDDPHIRWVNEGATFVWVALLAGFIDILVLRLAVSLFGADSLGSIFASKSVALTAAGVVRLAAYRTRLFTSVRDEQRGLISRPPSSGGVRLSVVVPAFREGARIQNTVFQIWKAIREIENNGGLEIVVVDDGSSDDTAANAWQAGADRVIKLPKNSGKGAALRAGVRVCEGRTIAIVDADLSYPPAQLLTLLRQVEEGWDMVVGSRKHVETATLVRARRLREVGSRVFNTFTRALLLGQYRDTQCGIKAFRSDAARLLFSKSRIERFAFDVELFHLAERYHLTLAEVPVTVVHSETSSVSVVRDAAQMIWDVFRIRWWAGKGLYDLKPGEGLGSVSVVAREQPFEDIVWTHMQETSWQEPPVRATPAQPSEEPAPRVSDAQASLSPKQEQQGVGDSARLLLAVLVAALGIVTLVGKAYEGKTAVGQAISQDSFNKGLGEYNAYLCTEKALLRNVPKGSRVFIEAKDQNQLIYARTAEFATPWMNVTLDRSKADYIVTGYKQGSCELEIRRP